MNLAGITIVIGALVVAGTISPWALLAAGAALVWLVLKR